MGSNSKLLPVQSPAHELLLRHCTVQYCIVQYMRPSAKRSMFNMTCFCVHQSCSVYHSMVIISYFYDVLLCSFSVHVCTVQYSTDGWWNCNNTTVLCGATVRHCATTTPHCATTTPHFVGIHVPFKLTVCRPFTVYYSRQLQYCTVQYMSS